MLFPLLAAVAAFFAGRALARSDAPSGPTTWEGYSMPALPPPNGGSPAPTPPGAALPPPGKGQVQLIPGTRYRAVLVLSGIQAAASNDMVAAELRKLMKSPVQVWDTRPSTWAVATPDAGFFESVRWAEGVYMGAPRNVTLQPAIRRVWTA